MTKPTDNIQHFSTWLYDPDDPNLVATVEADIEEFRFTCPDKERLIKYTIWCYDPHTDLLKLFVHDFSRRKYESGIKAGFMLNPDGKFDPWVEDCMVGANERYNDALVAFVTRFNVADLPAYVMYREIFFTEMKATMVAGDSKAKREAMANAETARVRLMELERRLFTGDEVLEIRNALYVKAEKMLLQLRPEAMARAIEKKELNMADPYFKKRGRPRKQKEE